MAETKVQTSHEYGLLHRDGTLKLIVTGSSDHGHIRDLEKIIQAKVDFLLSQNPGARIIGTVGPSVVDTSGFMLSLKIETDPKQLEEMEVKALSLLPFMQWLANNQSLYGTAPCQNRQECGPKEITRDDNDGSISIRAWGSQECVRSDLAIVSFFLALLRSQKVQSMERIRIDQTALMTLYTRALDLALPEERMYLPIIRERVEGGPLDRRITKMIESGLTQEQLIEDLARCMRTNRPFIRLP